MGGIIGVESDRDCGSIFWLELPAIALGKAEKLSNDTYFSIKPLTTIYDKKILLVEDNEVNREVARALLERFGTTVQTANDGQKALDLIASDDFDLIIMDLRMPIMDGITATKLLRQRGCITRVVGLPANAFEVDRQLCLAAGVNSFTAKPIIRDKILSILNDFLNFIEDSDSSNLVDRRQFDPVYKELGPDLFYEMLQHLEQNTRPFLELAHTINLNAKPMALDHDLHTVKGAAATLGLAKLAAHAQALRDKINIGPKDIETFIDLLDRSVTSAKIAIRQAPEGRTAENIEQ